MKRLWTLWAIALTVAIAFLPAPEVLARGGHGGGGPVSVRGYTRSDGTYVAPHYRSAPDGNFDNNWSTKGNVNPYTGAEGTRVTPPSGYSGSTSGDSAGAVGPSWVVSAPVNQIPDAPTTGTTGLPGTPPRMPRPSGEPTSDERMRIRAAGELQALGYTVDWQEHPWTEMQDWASRIRKANDLRQLGVETNWRTHSWTDMQDWEIRIRKASDLGRLGLQVSWQEHSWNEMQDWEIRARKAVDLARIGVVVDWRNYSWIQLSGMQRDAEARRRGTVRP